MSQFAGTLFKFLPSSTSLTTLLTYAIKTTIFFSSPALLISGCYETRTTTTTLVNMTKSSQAPYNPSLNSTPLMELPEQVYGHIDLMTLADIHKCLSQSESAGDLALANWVKEHYLQKPTTRASHLIRTTEAFSKLEQAYHRVRLLTNKAQDKWPFFDRNWKTMSSATVKNNARGQFALGVSLQGMSTNAKAPTVTQGGLNIPRGKCNFCGKNEIVYS